MRDEKEVYLFKKDGSCEVINTKSDRIAYCEQDYNSTLKDRRSGDDYIVRQEPRRINLKVKTLTKFFRIGDEYTRQFPSVIEKELECRFKYAKAVSVSDCDIYDLTYTYKMELNYAVAEDSPLHTIISSLEGQVQDTTDWQSKYIKSQGRVSELESEEVSSAMSIKNNKERISELELLADFYYQANSNPTAYFIYTLVCSWIINIFKRK